MIPTQKRNSTAEGLKSKPLDTTALIEVNIEVNY